MFKIGREKKSMQKKLDIDTLFPVASTAADSLLPWLKHQESLTDRLRTKAGNVHLEVLGQYWTSPNWWDKQVLHIQDEAVLHREILMWSADEPCWYARTIIPKTTYNANSEFFERLKNESLGLLIFNQPKVKRVSFVYYPIDSNSIEYHWLKEITENDSPILWVRMSIFTIENHDSTKDLPFCLVEIMLPGLMRYPN